MACMAQGGSNFDPPSFFSQRLQWGSDVSQGGFNPHNPPANFYTDLDNRSMQSLDFTVNRFIRSSLER